MAVIIDPQNSGISGNMVLGAMVDLGLDPEAVTDIMEHYASYFGDIKIHITKLKKSGIEATYVDVRCEDKGPIKYTELIDILGTIEHPEFTFDMVNFSKKVFKTLADVESHVHGTTTDQIHFHEVGAADAVADIVGVSYGFHKLGMNNKKIYGMPAAMGGGRINSMHGKLTVPAPATLEILKNVPTFGGPVNYELTTPTGAALLVNMVNQFVNFYPILANKTIGYGAGKMNLSIPNILRIVDGNSQLGSDQVSILETSLDNVTGELMGHIFSKLMDAGARDVSVIPTLTKKNRPGYLLRVISKPTDFSKLSEAIMRETGTLGVRIIPYVHRNVASRRIIPVEFTINETKVKINIKVGMIGQEIISVKPEFEDVKKVSNETNIPLKDVMNMAEEIFRKDNKML